MRNLIKYGLLNHSRIWLLFSGLLVVAVCAYFLIMGYQQAGIDYNALAIQEYYSKLEMTQNTVSRYLADNQGLDEAQRDGIQANLSSQETSLLEMIAARGKDDWKAELHHAILQGEAELQLSEFGVVDYDFTVERQVSLNRYLLENGIKPKIPPNACDGLNVLKMFFEWMAFPVFSVCPLLFSVILIVSEKQQGGIRFMLQLPVRRRQVLLSKYIVVFVRSLATAAITALVLFVSCSVLFGFGDPEYPIALADGAYLSTGAFLLNGLLSAVCSILFFSALGVLVSVCVTNEIIGVVLSVFIPVVSFMLQSWLNGNAYLLPFLSANVYSLVTQTSLPILLTSAVQILSAAALLLLANIIFEKEDLA